jgi:dipeptidyl aminopeptidase/acylaminoacyl peptidase
MRFTVKARDGKTDLYGDLWKPTTFDASGKDASKKYPVVDEVYPGPQDGSCSVSGPPSFKASHGDNQALADLGFVVLCLDGMGNPHRSKSFHDAHASSPAEMGDDTIPDQVAGIKELAARFAWIDVDRVGIWGHSGGGNATVSAMFHFPDFFKVGWAESGNHDQRDYEDDWDERWAGLETIGPNGEDNYAAQANENYASNLKGHLMLTHGTMDDNVPMNNTLLVVDALIKANKNFDLLMIPNVHHGYAEATPYVTRRRWDYFVRYLGGGVPPNEYQMTNYDEMMRKMYGPAPAERTQ